MPIDRKTLLEQHSVARRMMRDQDLSPQTRALAKRAVDLAEVSLAMQDAIARKQAREAAAAQMDNPLNRPPSADQ
jgi:hypothetical protein